MQFLVNLYNKKSALLVFNSTRKAIDKLSAFLLEYGSKGDDLAVMHLRSIKVKTCGSTTLVCNVGGNPLFQMDLYR